MLTICICDDDELYLKMFCTLVENYSNRHDLEIRVMSFFDAKYLEEYLAVKENRPDLVFLDIEMKDQNGIEVAKNLHEICPTCNIVFLTNYISYATDVYETDHFYYVLKEELPNRLENILKRYFEQNHRIIIKSGRKEWCFYEKEIIYVERGRRCSYIKTADGSKNKLTISFDQVAEYLPKPAFARCHYSFLINLGQLRCFQSEEVAMNDGTIIPVSRSYRAESRSQFLEWQEIWI